MSFLPINQILKGDSLTVLKTLPSDCFDSCVTSPPYFNQRDYREKDQLGREATVEAYIDSLFLIFEEVKRVLKPTGSLWLNIGDSFNTGKKGNTNGTGKGTVKQKQGMNDQDINKKAQVNIPRKSLLMIPERMALKLITEGNWCLRSRVIWHKPDAMPIAAPDRFTPDYEYLYHFIKDPDNYYFDTQYEPYRTDPKQLKQYMTQDYKGQSSEEYEKSLAHNPSDTKRRIINSMRKRATTSPRFGGNKQVGDGYGSATYSGKPWNPNQQLTRIMRSVWTIRTAKFAGKHYAAYPEKLIDTPLNATVPKHVCRQCGFSAKIRYDVERHNTRPGHTINTGKSGNDGDPHQQFHKSDITKYRQKIVRYPKGMTDCGHNDYESGICLDPFLGSGTTALVALKQGKRFVGIELSQDYIDIAWNRIREIMPYY